MPEGTRCIDLAVLRSVPTFAQVLYAVLNEMQVERVELALETAPRSPHIATLPHEPLGG